MTRQPPQRLLDDPSVAAQLRGDLANVRAQGTTYDVEAGLAALRKTLDGPMGGSIDDEAGSGRELAHPSSRSAEWSESLRAVATRWWGWTAVGLAGVGAIWWMQRASPAPSVERAARGPVAMQVAERSEASQRGGDVRDAVLAAPLEARVVADTQAERDTATPGVERASLPRAKAVASRRGVASGVRATATRTDIATPTDVATPTSAVRAPDTATAVALEADAAPRPTSASTTPPSTAGQAGMAEVEHLSRVRRLLATAPNEALIAARDGQKTFANGLFVEERAGLIVFALAELGQVDEALREGRGFLRAHPDGPFAARIRAIVARFASSEQ